MSKRSKIVSTDLLEGFLVEVAWEVCNQVGGIYTVIRSKAPAMVKHWGTSYCMVGPFLNKNILAELEPLNYTVDIFGQAAANLRNKGYDVVYAEWLVTGRPRVVLLNPKVIEEKTINVVKYLLWKNYAINIPPDNNLINQVVAFSYLAKLFFEELVSLAESGKSIIGHFHEWMAGLPILEIKRERMPVKTLFTTHATQLGRHLAINSPLFYAHLPFFKWEEEAKKFGVEAEAQIEFSCANKADVLSTVSGDCA
jgi:glycogen(starch) synthase